MSELRVYTQAQLEVMPEPWLKEVWKDLMRHTNDIMHKRKRRPFETDFGQDKDMHWKDIMRVQQTLLRVTSAERMVKSAKQFIDANV